MRNAYQHQVLEQLVWGLIEEKPTLDDCCELVIATSNSLLQSTDSTTTGRALKPDPKLHIS